METRPLRARAALITAVLGLAAAATVAAYTLAGDEMRRRPELADGLVLSAGLLSIAAILYRLRSPGSWKSAKFIGLGILAIATAGAVFLRAGSSRQVRPSRSPPTSTRGRATARACRRCGRSPARCCA